MEKKAFLTRREMLRATALVGAGAVLAACQPKIVEKVVKETVVVTEEKVVEKEVTTVVEKEKVVTQIVKRLPPRGPATNCPKECPMDASGFLR